MTDERGSGNGPPFESRPTCALCRDAVFIVVDGEPLCDWHMGVKLRQKHPDGVASLFIESGD